MSLKLDKSAWKRVRFGDIVRRSRRQVDPLKAGVERYVAGGHIDGDSITVDRWGDPSDGHMGSTFRYVFEPGQIVFVSARPYLRKSGVVGFSGVVADKTYVLDAVPENGLLQDLLPFVLASDSFIAYANAEATGSMNPRLLWGPMQRYEFELPPLDEQQPIADLLWAIERHRVASMERTREARIGRTAAFREWLASAPAWGRLGDQFEVQLGKMLSKTSQPTDNDQGFPYLANLNVRWGRFDMTEVRRVCLSDHEREKFRLRDGDVLVCEGGEVGRAAIWDDAIEECYYQKALHRLRPTGTDSLPGPIIVSLLELLAGEGRLAAHSTGTTFTHLTRERLLELQLPIVPERMAAMGTSMLAEFDRAIELGDAECADLYNLRAEVVTEVFGGN